MAEEEYWREGYEDEGSRACRAGTTWCWERQAAPWVAKCAELPIEKRRRVVRADLPSWAWC